MLAVLLACSAHVTALAAEPGAAECEMVARTLGFLTVPPTGAIELGVVYPAGSPAGYAEAQRIVGALGSRFVVDDITLLPKPVTVEEAGRGGLRVLLLTQAALPQAGALGTALAGKRVLTAITDPASADSRFAVVAVSAQPSIEIFVSQAAAKSAGLQFSSAFRMLIQER